MNVHAPGRVRGHLDQSLGAGTHVRRARHCGYCRVESYLSYFQLESDRQGGRSREPSVLDGVPRRAKRGRKNAEYSPWDRPRGGVAERPGFEPGVP